MSLLHQVLLDSPVGFWPLDETAGTNADDRGSASVDGTYTGGFTLGAAGPAGLRAVEFNGSTGYVAIPDNPAFSPATPTLEAWAYRVATGGATQMILTKSQDPHEWAMFLSSGTLFVNIYNTGAGVFAGVSDPSPMPLATWVHYAMTWDGTTQRLYRDGVQVATNTATSGTRQGDTVAAVNIGRRAVPDSYFTGRVCFAAIYATALAAERVKAHYEAGIRNGVVI